MHFCFFAQFVEFSLNIANICAAAVWSGRLETIARDISMEQGCNYSGHWTAALLRSRYQQNLHENTGTSGAAVGQNWSTDIFNGNKKLAAMCHGRFCFQAPLIAQGRKNGQKGRKQTDGKIFNELQGSRIAPAVTVGWWWPD